MINHKKIRVNIHGYKKVGKTCLYKLYLGDLFDPTNRITEKAIKFPKNNNYNFS